MVLVLVIPTFATLILVIVLIWLRTLKFVLVAVKDAQFQESSIRFNVSKEVFKKEVPRWKLRARRNADDGGAIEIVGELGNVHGC